MTNNKLTAETITEDQIRARRELAVAAGDCATVQSCDVALSPHETTDAEGRPLYDDDRDPTTRSAQRAALADLLNEEQAVDEEDRLGDHPAIVAARS